MKKMFLISLILFLFQFVRTTNNNYAQNPASGIKGKWACVVISAPVFNSPLKRNDIKKVKPAFRLKMREIIEVVEKINSNNEQEYDWLKIKIGDKYYYTPYEYSAPYKFNNPDTNLPYNYIINRIANIPFDYKPNDLKQIPQKFISPYLQKYSYFLRKDALKAFISLFEKASKENINIFIASAWRSPEVQSPLYLKNIEIAGPKQTGSAKPTHSEHHLGTVCDVTSKSVNYRLTQDFYNTKEYKWLKTNLKNFNMRITYSKENHKREGYMWEPWHIRFMGKN